MNKEKFILSCVSVFAFIFLFDWIFHDYVIDDLFEDSASLWRPDSEVLSYLLWSIFGKILLSVLFCLIFLHGYENKGLGEGIRYGLLIGLLLTAPLFMFFSMQPIPANLFIAWLIGGVIEIVIAGMILAAIYRPQKS